MIYAIDVDGSKLAESEYDRGVQRVAAWHRVFESAITGLSFIGIRTAEEIVIKATAIADAAHGSLS